MSRLAMILGATLGSVFAAYYLLSMIGPSLHSGFGVVIAAIVSLWVKILLQHHIFNNIRLDRQGYDLCVLTMGTALTTFAAEYNKGEFTVGRASALFAIFVSALLASLLTGANSKAIQAAMDQRPPIKVRAEALKNITGFGFGFVLLIINFGVLITKL